ncbi:MAG: outer membrane protein [Cyclobacteriaceae bacterium]|jgi:outer membrane protein
MIMKKIVGLTVLTVVCALCHAQIPERTLTLDECIEVALDRNLMLKQAKNNELIAKSNQLQSIMNHLPTISAGANYDYFFGTTFDQNAARQVTATTSSSNPNIQGNWVVFNGLSAHQTRKQRTSEYLAAQNNVENTMLTTEAGILNAYLSTLMGEENIRISDDRVKLLEVQLERSEKRESVGVGNMEDVYNFRSQLANEKLTLQNLKNTYQQNLLSLLQGMRLDPTESQFRLEPVIATEEDLLTEIDPFGQVLSECLTVNPAVSGAQSSLDAAKFQYKATWGQRLPTIRLFGITGSNYSTNGATNPEIPFLNPDSGQPGFNFEPDATFSEQMGYNQFEYVNFSINIPIFDRLRGSNQVQTSKLNMDNARLSVEMAVQDITNAVQSIYLDLVSAQTTYTTAVENLVALQQTFDFMERRYETGNTDFYTYLESLNNKNRAEIQLINAKYSIVLRKKVLDAYRML